MAAKRRDQNPPRKSAAVRSNMKLFYGILAAVAVTGVAGLLFLNSDTGEAVTAPIELSEVQDAQALLARARGISLGPETAAAQVLVFSDYMCPGCMHWATTVEPFVKQEFVEQGGARLVFYDYPLPNHPYSFIAARAARCAGDQERFWEYHDLLFNRQGEWSYDRSVPLGRFAEYARTLQLNAPRFEQCLNSDAHADVVTANKLLGDQVGVRGTPTVFVNGRQVESWSDWNAVRAAIQEAGGE